MKNVFFKSCFSLFAFLFSLNVYSSDYTDSQGVQYTYINSTTCYVDESYKTVRDKGIQKITIPSTIKGRSVVKIGTKAFSFCYSITSITLPQTITEIGEDAFSFCSEITSITIPNSVTAIDKDAFENCSGLKTIKLSNQLKVIGDYAFSYCESLTSITIPKSVVSIGKYVFSNSGNIISMSVEAGNSMYDSRDNCNAIIETESNKLLFGCGNTKIPNGIKSIENYAFYGSNILKSIHIPQSVSSISYWVFGNCKSLTTITVDSHNVYYDSRNNCNAIISNRNELIAGCKNTKIPQTVTSIRSYAFYHCAGLTSVEIPRWVKKIGSSAFAYCEDLTAITIQSPNIAIDKSAFYDCDNLRTINSYITNPVDITEDVFMLYKSSYSTTDNSEVVYQNAKLYIPRGTKSLYQQKVGWKKFKSVVEKFVVDNSGISTGTELQTKIDEIAAAGTTTEDSPETIVIADDGILIEKTIFIPNKCHVVITGGPIYITPRSMTHAVFFWKNISGNSSTRFKNIKIDCSGHITNGVDYYFDEVEGNLYFENTCSFVNCSLENTIGLCRLHGGESGTVFFTSSSGFKADHLLIDGGGGKVFVNGNLESTETAITSGYNRNYSRVYVYGGTISGGSDVVVGAGEFLLQETGTIKSTRGNATLVDAGRAEYYNDNLYGANCNIVVRESATIGGNNKMPEILLCKDAVITVISKMEHEWKVNSSEWDLFALEKAIIQGNTSYKLTEADFQKMSFVNMPTEREAYYDDATKTVKLRERKVCDADDLGRFLRNLSGSQSEVDIPLCDEATIDEDVEVDDDLMVFIDGLGKNPPQRLLFAHSFICYKNVNSNWTFRSITFANKDDATGGGIKNVGALTFRGCTFMSGDYVIENLSGGRLVFSEGTVVEGQGNIINSGSVYVDGTVSLADMQNKQGGRIYITSSLTKDIHICIEASDVELGVPIIFGGEGYSLTEADLSHIHLTLPVGYEWKYDAVQGGIVISQATGMISINAGQPDVVDSYDATGRKVGIQHNGLTLQRKSDGTVKKVIIK